MFKGKGALRGVGWWWDESIPGSTKESVLRVEEQKRMKVITAH